MHACYTYSELSQSFLKTFFITRVIWQMLKLIFGIGEPVKTFNITFAILFMASNLFLNMTQNILVKEIEQKQLSIHLLKWIDQKNILKWNYKLKKKWSP